MKKRLASKRSDLYEVVRDEGLVRYEYPTQPSFLKVKDERPLFAVIYEGDEILVLLSALHPLQTLITRPHQPRLRLMHAAEILGVCE